MTATATAAAQPGRRIEQVDSDQDRAYDEGMRAFSAGVMASACPYPAHSLQHDAWQSGWYDFAHAVQMLPDD